MSSISDNLFYTRDIGRLTLDQRLFYEKNGYIVIPQLVFPEILRKCSQRFDDIASGRVDKGHITVMKDITDKKSVNKVQDLNFDQVFRQYIEYKKILDIVETFTGPNIIAAHTMLIAKPPDAGSRSSRHPPHQDLYYFPFRPANRIVAAWTAIERCDTENGCLFVSPGSHTINKLLPHTYPRDSDANNKFYHGIQELPDSTKWIDLEMEPGDTAFFHPLLIHGSGVNRSNRTRKAISCHYAAAECHYIDVTGTVQEDLKNEILEMVSKKYPGLDVDYTTIWRFKSSIVRGIRSIL
ncbi:phytanoyl-CoA dioxygenase, peroxisomal-like [Chelonus insularis]|uniref:phytanoyl-CoA dioxygenase, peroxisomal-like n=1 Tax=Chelonus insularis TaxID=460826 RepID=UPI00158894A6|nr:phytanoyl-CoA dioxygenase, peroxisomal-like [Chelonus insularis]XP_034951901.1 phytanoyl-CoA dioxygenase, peroxisomal-like [Chelonus insularis]